MIKAKHFYLFISLLILSNGSSQPNNNQSQTEFDYEIRFEKTNSKETATYEEMIAFYNAADRFSSEIQIKKTSLF